MAGKVYKMAFRIAGELSGDFVSSFKKSSKAITGLKNDIKQSRDELNRMRKSLKDGTMSTNEFEEAQKRIQRQISESTNKIAIHTRRINAMRTAYKGASEVTRTGFGIAKDATVIGGYAAIGAAAYTVGASASKAMNYEAQLSSIKAIGGLDQSQMGDVDKLALEVGAETKYSALEAAQGMEELIKAGVSTEKIMNGALLDALNLATAGDLELAEAAEIMSTSLNAFNTEGVTSAEAANLLAGAAVSSATSVSEMNYGLSQVSASASMVGLSLKDVTVGLAVFANNGQKGSDAGTSFKTMLTRLTPVTKAQIEQFRELGLLTEDGNSKFYDANGELRSLSEIAGMLRKSLQHLNGEQRKVAIETMFGSDAQRAASVLYKEGAEGVEAMAESMQEIKVADVAAEKMNNAKGAIERLSGAWETAQITVGKSFFPVVEKGANALGSVIENNQGKIETASQKIEQSLLRIAAPLVTIEAPKFDSKRAKTDEVYRREYQIELQQYNKFKGMDFSDRFIYAFDTALTELDGYIGGDGAEKISKIFVHLAEIGVNSFVSTLGTLLKTGMQQVMEGNIAAAAGLLVGANMMTRGLLMKGTGGFLKFSGKKSADVAKKVWVWDKRKGKKGAEKNNDEDSSENTPNELDKKDKENKKQSLKERAADAVDAAKKGKVEESEKETPVKEQVANAINKKEKQQDNAEKTTQNTKLPEKERAAKAVNAVKKGKISGIAKAIGTGVGKIFAPLAAFGSVATIATAENKKEAIAKEGGSLVGMAAGGKLGAVVGTVVAPGIGTAIGGVAGSALGAMGGTKIGETVVKGLGSAKEAVGKFFSWFGKGFKSKKEEVAKKQIETQKAQPAPLPQPKQNTDITKGAQEKLDSATKETTLKFNGLQTNLGMLSDKISSSSQGINSLAGIGTASQNVISALNNYATRLNNVQIQQPSQGATKSSSLIPKERTDF